MRELYLDAKGLVSEEKWKEVVGELKKESLTLDPSESDLKNKLIDAVKNRVLSKPFGVFFSGGVDSSLIALICKQLGCSFKCYCVGFKTENMETPLDVLYARRVAAAIGVELVEKIYDVAESEEILKEVVSMLDKPKQVDIDYVVKTSVGMVVVGASKIASEKVFFSGLGSEELFAGYDRHSTVEDVSAECWSGLANMLGRDLVRDCRLAEKLGIEFRTPFLDSELIKTAMRIPSERKINSKEKKIILREVAEELGLEHEFAWRKKQGAQYGSKSIKLIEKLAQRAGLKLKKEYLAKLVEQLN